MVAVGFACPAHQKSQLSKSLPSPLPVWRLVLAENLPQLPGSPATTIPRPPLPSSYICSQYFLYLSTSRTSYLHSTVSGPYLIHFREPWEHQDAVIEPFFCSRHLQSRFSFFPTYFSTYCQHHTKGPATATATRRRPSLCLPRRARRGFPSSLFVLFNRVPSTRFNDPTTTTTTLSSYLPSKLFQ